MAEDSSRKLEQIAERLDYLEMALRDQIGRIYSIEKHLGIANRIETKPSVQELPRPSESVHVEPPPQAIVSSPIVDEQLEQKAEQVTPPVQTPSSPVPPVEQAPQETPARPYVWQEVRRPSETFASSSEQTEPSSPPKPARSLEAMIGGSWFNFIGIFAIIIGVGLFLKLAFDREWIGPAGRVAIGVALGIGFLFGGEKMRAKGYRLYSQGLLGGGIAILYLSFFAAFARYQIIGQMPAMVLMTMVTATAVLMSARYDALAIAILGLIGGFLTPVMLSTGVDNQVGLFSYIVLIDLGVLAVAYFKQWRILNYLAFAATVLMTAAWMAEWYKPEKLWTTIFFLTVLFTIFALLAVFHNIIRRSLTRWPEIALIFINAFLYFTTSYALLEVQYRPYLGLFAVLLSAFYLGFGYLAYSRDREDKYLILTFLGLASLFLTLAIPIQLDQHWVTMGWAIEGAVLVWIGLRANSLVTRIAAAIVFLVAVTHWVAFDAQEFGYLEWNAQHFVPILNRRAISAAVMLASFAYSAWQYLRARNELDQAEMSVLGGGYLLAANVTGVVLLTIDAFDYYSQAIRLASIEGAINADHALVDAGLRESQQFTISLIWILYASAMLAFGVLRRLRPMRLGALALLALASMKVLTADTKFHSAVWHTLIFNKTFGIYILLVAALALAARWYARASIDDPEEGERRAVVAGIDTIERKSILSVLVAATGLLLLIALSVEASGYFTARINRANGENWQQYSSLRHFSLSALWSVYAGAALIYGITRRQKWIRFGALWVLAICAVKLLMVDAQYFTLPWHVPVFNPTFISFALFVAALVAGLWFYSQAGEEIDEAERGLMVMGLMIAANIFAILALTLEANGYFTIKINNLQTGNEEFGDLQLARQLSLSVIWAVYGGAMLVWGIKRGQLLLRVMGLILLGVTIVKVFFFDLSSLDKIYRIISFIVLGAILLGVSFLYQQWQRRTNEEAGQ